MTRANAGSCGVRGPASVPRHRRGRAGHLARPTGETAAVLRAAIDAEGSNVTSFAHRYGIPEGTLRRTLDGRNCISSDRLLSLAGRCPAVREAVSLRVVVALPNGFAIETVEIPAGTPPADQAQRLRELASEVQADARRFADLVGEAFGGRPT